MGRSHGDNPIGPKTFETVSAPFNRFLHVMRATTGLDSFARSRRMVFQICVALMKEILAQPLLWRLDLPACALHQAMDAAAHRRLATSRIIASMARVTAERA